MARSFEPSRALETDYSRVLRQVSRQIGLLLRRYFDEKGGLFDVDGFVAACEEYGIDLEPWAIKTATRFVERVEKGNSVPWNQSVKQALKTAVKAGGVGVTAGVLWSVYQGSQVHHAAVDLMQEQAALIKSLPRKAAERVQAIALEAALDGDRSSVLYKKILETEVITEARAALIARTELARANAVFTRARANAVGLTHYIWRTVGDERVRDAHQQMEGQICEFARPPAVEGEGNHHAGEYFNCRCFAEPIFSKSGQNT